MNKEMMEKWCIKGTSLYVNGKECVEMKIIDVRPGPCFEEIEIHCQKEKGRVESRIFKLKGFTPSPGTGFIESIHQKSRTEFLKWLCFGAEDSQNTAQQSDQEEPSSRQEDKNNSSVFGIAQEENNEEHGLHKTEVNPVQQTEEQDVDGESKLIGENVTVHISNLTPPEESRQVRPLNRQHVENLTKAFRNNFIQWTPIVGVIFTDKSDTLKYEEQGSCKIEVLGGNHTREALVEVGEVQDVKVRLYCNLTNKQCLQIGIKHNKVHENSRRNTYFEECLLARKLLNNTVAQFPNLSKKMQMTCWREAVAAVFDICKEDLKNKFRVLLHIASMPEDVWDIFVQICQQWELKKIKKQTNEIAKNTFACLTNVGNHEHKKQLLLSLLSGNMDFMAFKKECGKSKIKSKPSKISIRTEDNLEREKSPDVHEYDTEGSEEEVVKEGTEEDTDNNKNETSNKLEESVDRLSDETGKLQLLKAQIVHEKKERSRLEKIVKEKDCQIRDMEHTIEQHVQTIQILKSRVIVAEGAAARARTKLNEVSEKMKTTQQPKAKTRENSVNESESQTQKQIPPRSKKRKSGQCAQVTKKPVQNVKRKRQNKPQPNDTEKAQQQEMDVVSQDAQKINCEDSDPVEQQCALVEYVNKKCYLGQYKDDKMIFCQKPCGTVNNLNLCHVNHLNLKDIQYIDKKYVIKNFKCMVKNDKILLDMETMKILDAALEQYLEESEK